MQDKFKALKDGIIINDSMIKGTKYWSEIMGTFPFKISTQQNTFKWQLKITKFNSKRIGSFQCNPLICFGIKDKEDKFSTYCKSSGGKYKKIGLSYTEPIPTNKFGINDTITIALNHYKLKFSVNDKILSEETDYIPKNLTLQELFCYIVLDESTEIHHIELNIL